jgi:hypothetical protein
VRVHPWSLLLTLILAPPGCDRGGTPSAAPAQPEAAAAAAAGAEAAPGIAAAQADAPGVLNYASDPSVYTRGTAIAPNTPFCSGGTPTSYRVSPPLPSGLVLDPVSGSISGTPTALAPQRTYEVTASNASGSASATLTLTVNDQAPGQAPVVTLPPFVTASVDGLTASTQDQGKGVTYDWVLTNGTLSGGQGSRSITFKAGAQGTVTAQVNVRNSGGTQAGQGQAVIVPAPEAVLHYPPQVRAGASATATCSSAQDGATCTWAILPGTSGATLAAGQGTPAVTLTAGPAAGTFKVQLTVQNRAGNQAVATAEVKVVP